MIINKNREIEYGAYYQTEKKIKAKRLKKLEKNSYKSTIRTNKILVIITIIGIILSSLAPYIVNAILDSN